MKKSLLVVASAVAASLGCAPGQVVETCLSTSTECDGICVNVQTDRGHCGACGNACADGFVCSAGACVLSCQAALTNCSGVCRDLATDGANCGACGNVCPGTGRCAGGSCSCAPLAGPSLPQNISGYANSGIEVTALQDTILWSLTFENQGFADTISLAQGTTTLATLAVPAGTPNFTPIVSWPLASGITYRITNANGTNGKWTSYTDFPTSTDTLRVERTWLGSGPSTAYWFSFVNLTTCPP